MDAKLKRQWVKALRSGRYKQGASNLKHNGRYCCLGVLCCVMGARWVEKHGDLLPELDGKIIAVEGEEVLRRGFRSKIGITKANQDKLVDMNDGKPWPEEQPAQSFKVIADYIEKNL